MAYPRPAWVADPPWWPLADRERPPLFSRPRTPERTIRVPTTGPNGAFLLIRQLPRISGGWTAVLCALILGQVLGAVLLPLATGRLVAALTGAEAAVFAGLALLAAALVLDVVLDPVRAVVTARLGAAVDVATAQRTVEGALRPPGIAHLDDPKVADAIEQARAVGVGSFPPREAVAALAGLVPLRLTGIAAAVLLGWAGAWWMPLVLGAAWIVTGHWQELEIRRSVSAHSGEVAQLRQAGYLRDLATTPAAAKEVRLFGLHSWLVTGFTRCWWDGMVQLRRTAINKSRHTAAVFLLLAGHAAVIGPLAVWAADGALSPSSSRWPCRRCSGCSRWGSPATCSGPCTRPAPPSRPRAPSAR